MVVKMKIIFLNTWHGDLHDELRGYVAKHVNDTDVFCFQESTNTMRSAFEDLLASDFKSIEVAKENAELKTNYGNVMFIRNEFTVKETGTLFNDDHQLGMAIFAKLEVDGDDVTVCNVHGVPFPGDKLDTAYRLDQSKHLIDTFAGKSSVIIGGDFNLMPETESVQMFRRNGYQNLITDYEITTTRNQITYDRHPDNIQYFADYAFVSNGVTVESFVVPADVVSDHQPLELKVRFVPTLVTSNDIAAVESAGKIIAR